MDERKYHILRAIIDDYILTAMPVGSRTISKKYDIGGLSSATIRNEMSDLEALGYLDQPHTSSGRVPSAKAYRFYVEELLRGTNTLPTEEAKRLRLHFDQRAGQVADVISRAAQAISEVTRYTAVATMPKAHSFHIKKVQLVSLTEKAALLILLTDEGLIKDTVIPVDSHLTEDHLHEISKMLTEQLSGLSAVNIRDKLHDIIEAFGLHRKMLHGVLEAVEKENVKDIMVGGRANILQYPEYSDTEKARAVLSVLETREKLSQLMRTGPRMTFTIRIGEETGMPETSDCSVVSMTYHIGDDATGTIGVIGPRRMRYARVIPVLEYMGKALADLLRETGQIP